MWPNPQETADLVTFTDEILNEELHFLYSVNITNFKWFLSKILKQTYAETDILQIREVVVPGCSSKWMFLNLSQTSQKHLCCRLFLVKLQAWRPEDVFHWNLQNLWELIFLQYNSGGCFWDCKDTFTDLVMFV